MGTMTDTKIKQMTDQLKAEIDGKDDSISLPTE
jgi:hypothetical protein